LKSFHFINLTTRFVNDSPHLMDKIITPPQSGALLIHWARTVRSGYSRNGL
jgi:hypothetical protein